MFSLNATDRYFLCVGSVDLRKGFRIVNLVRTQRLSELKLYYNGIKEL